MWTKPRRIPDAEELRDALRTWRRFPRSEPRPPAADGCAGCATRCTGKQPAGGHMDEFHCWCPRWEAMAEALDPASTVPC